MTSVNHEPASQDPPQADLITSPDASADLLADSMGDYLRIVFRRIRAGESGALPVIIGLVAVVIFFQVRNSLFLSAGNLVNLLAQSAFIITLGMAEIFVLLLGDIDLAAGVHRRLRRGGRAVDAGARRPVVGGGPRLARGVRRLRGAAGDHRRQAQPALVRGDAGRPARPVRRAPRLDQRDRQHRRRRRDQPAQRDHQRHRERPAQRDRHLDRDDRHRGGGRRLLLLRRPPPPLGRPGRPAGVGLAAQGRRGHRRRHHRGGGREPEPRQPDRPRGHALGRAPRARHPLRVDDAAGPDPVRPVHLRDRRQHRGGPAGPASTSCGSARSRSCSAG